MKHLQLYQKLSQYRQLETNFWDDLSERVKTIKYETKEILLDINEIPKRIHFIKSGGMLGYREHEDRQVLVRIWKPNDMILHIDQAIDIRRSNLQIVAATDSITLELVHKEIEDLKIKYPDMRLYLNQLLVEELRFWQDISFWRQTKIHKEKHYECIDSYGGLYNSLSNKDKGSYIGASERYVLNLE